jgi:NAD(P)-dependent dehydrogenase (short-subunit alcohol dehydrogenase family)
MTSAEAAPSPFHRDLFAGQVALVTGGATGIGKEICRSLGEHGARIAIISRKQEVLDATAAELAREGINVWVCSCDVRNAVAVRAAIEGLVAHYGRLDIVVNNAAGNFPAPMSRISPNGFKAVVDIDLLGTYNVSKAAFDVWLEAHGGNIVNITAPFEMKGAAWQSHVAAAKAGVDSLTRTCAVEWGPCGIRVNAIAPGPIASTEGMRRFAAAVPGSTSAEHSATTDSRPLRPRNPLGMVGHGRDIAHMLMYFCSPAGRFLSGQVIAVDGAGSVDLLKIDPVARQAAHGAASSW